MNGIFHNARFIFLAGTMLTAPASYAQTPPAPPTDAQMAQTQADSRAAQMQNDADMFELPPLPQLPGEDASPAMPGSTDTEAGTTGDAATDMASADMPPLPEPDAAAEEDGKVFSFDQPIEDTTGPSIFEDGVVAPPPSAEQPQSAMPPATAPETVPEAMPQAETDMGMDMDADFPALPPLPGDEPSAPEQAAQQAEDALGAPTLPQNVQVLDMFAPDPLALDEPDVRAELQKEQREQEQAAEAKAAPEPVKTVTKPKRKPEPVVSLPKEYRLPGTIYKKTYSTDNIHLPVARYEGEYDQQLFLAAGHDRAETVRSLLNTGRSTEMRNAQGETPLIFAIRNRAQNTVRMLLGKGANPNAADDRGISALHYAMVVNSPQMTAALLEMGADPNLPDMQGVTPLMYAASKKDPAYTQLLIRNGAAVNLPSVNGRTPLHVAAEHDNPQAAALLVQAGADIHAAKTRGYTPLMSAAAAGSGGVINVLLNAGADTYAADSLGRTAADIARVHGNEALSDRIRTVAIQRGQMVSHVQPVQTAPLMSPQAGNSLR